jgi:DDE superfamily endonuclease
MTLRSSASRGDESGTHLVTTAGEQIGVDVRVKQVLGPACIVAARMTDASDDKRHSLVSYNKADRAWAEWVGSGDQLVVEGAGDLGSSGPYAASNSSSKRCRGGISARSSHSTHASSGIGVLAAQAPDLHQVLEHGKAAGWTHVRLDGTLFTTDRCRTVNPDTGHDLGFSGKHREHGGVVQIVGDPDGHPVAVFDIEPGSTHDLAAAGATGLLGALHAAPPCWACPRWPTRATTAPVPAC